MSGRGKGRGGGFKGRGNSGRGNKSHNHNNNGSKPTKKTMSDHVYYLGSARQAADYETTTQYLINHIRKTYSMGDDIGKCLETLTEVDLSSFKPTMEISTDADPTIKAGQDRQYEIEYKEEFAEYKLRVKTYNENRTKACALFREQCAKGMQHKIESCKDYTIVNWPSNATVTWKFTISSYGHPSN